MSSEWPTVRLGEHVEACLGKMLDARKNKGTPQPYLGNSNVRWGQFDLTDLAEMRFEPHEEERYSLLPGDLVVCEGGEPGRCAIWNGPAGTKVQKALHRIRPKGTLDNYYLFYWFQQAAKAGLLEPYFTGTTIKHLTGKALAALEVPLPAIEVQRAMVDVLKQLDDRITLLRETNTTLEAIAQALFKSWFVDFDPVRAKMEGRQPEGMDEETAALFPDSFEESELGLVPKGWRTDFIEPWLSVLETGRRPRGGVAGISDGIPSIGAESIVRIGQFDFSKLKFVSNEFFTDMRAGRLTSRDVLLYKDGGKPGVFLPRVSMFGDGFPFDVCGINEHVFRIRLKEPFGQVFLYFWLWSDAVMHELKHRGGKAAIPGINRADVKELRLPVPSESVLGQFEELCNPIVGQILNNAKRIQTLSLLRDGLLPRLISGQIRLKEDIEATEDALA